MNKILIIVDKFKGSLTAREVASIIASQFHRQIPNIITCELPLADGGDGTLDAVSDFGHETLSFAKWQSLLGCGAFHTKRETPVLQVVMGLVL